MLRSFRFCTRLFVAMLAGMMLASAAGCHLFEISHRPVVHNPFPQLSRVAVAPFFNQSDEATVDGREFAMAYFAELQATPGFEVVPLGVVEEAILAHHVDLSNPSEARRLARILDVDAVVIGSVTDFTPYYPPRCGMRVEWYAANPGFHEIPPGYGLPWGTPEEEFIPEPLVFEAEMARAKAHYAAQAPDCPLPPTDLPAASATDAAMPEMPLPPQGGESDDDASKAESGASAPAEKSSGAKKSKGKAADAITAAYEEQVAEEELPPGAAPGASGDALLPALQSASSDAATTTGATGLHGEMVVDNAHGPLLYASPGGAGRPPCCPNNGPVMTHTRIYHGNDGDFAEALCNYYHFRNDARFGGWQNYLQRSDDFIRFCCHMHIAEMLSARGGADRTRVTYECCDCR
jgi:hypothetical protein